jgi:dihydroorotate dehydrogenase
MSFLYQLAPKAMRLIEAETAHGLTIRALQSGFGPKHPPKINPVLATSIAGLSLAGPVGLAAGFDKNAEVPGPMLRFGFGWVECGTVTPLAQAGNPRPRLFRLPKDQAVINRMGFNNQGLDIFVQNLKQGQAQSPACPIGANIGANKLSEDRIGDYCTGLQKLWGLPDWFTINISSPNTPGLRDLQSAEALDELLERISETREYLVGDQASPPIFLKVAPDLDEMQIEHITEAALRFGLSGLIVSNTTLARPSSLRSRRAREAGGLSGAPLFESSTKILRLFRQASKAKLPLIGVGGISNADQALQKIKAGASAVQLYSALIYQGPGLAARIHRELPELLHAEGFAKLSDAIGVDQSA